MHNLQIEIGLTSNDAILGSIV